MPSILKWFCNETNENRRLSYQMKIQSALILTRAFPADKTHLMVGKNKEGDHSFLLIESKNKDEITTNIKRIELYKSTDERNSSVGVLFGAPVIIAAHDATKTKFVGVELLSKEIILTSEQTEHLLRLVKEMSISDIRYSSGGDHSTYSSFFSGDEYQNCNSFIQKLLEQIGVIEETSEWNFDVMKLPSHVLKRVGVPIVADLQKENEELRMREKEKDEVRVQLQRVNEELEEKIRQLEQTK